MVARHARVEELPRRVLLEGTLGILLAIWLAVLPHHDAVGVCSRVIRMRLEEGDLLLELVVIRPKVIALKPGKVLALSTGIEVLPIGDCPHVAGAIQKDEVLRKLALEPLEQSPRTIWRAVLPNQHLVAELSLLAGDTFEALLNEALVVVDGDENRDKRPLALSKGSPTPWKPAPLDNGVGIIPHWVVFHPRPLVLHQRESKTAAIVCCRATLSHHR